MSGTIKAFTPALVRFSSLTFWVKNLFFHRPRGLGLEIEGYFFLSISLLYALQYSTSLSTLDDPHLIMATIIEKNKL